MIRRIAGMCLAATLGICHVEATLATNGVVLLDLEGNSADYAGTLSVGPTGRMYVTGDSQLVPYIGADYRNATGSDYLLALDGNGLLVPTFGTGGRLVSSNVPAYRGIVRPDDSLAFLDVRNVWNYSAAGASLLQQRVDTYGDLALQSDGKYVVFGAPRQISVPTTWTLKRLNTDGSFDTTLSGTGTVTTGAGGSAGTGHLIVLPNGQYLGAPT